MSSIRVLVVDDEPLARQRIVDLLKAEPDAELIAECRDGHEAVAAIEQHHPDLVFLDVQMPEADGFDVIEAVGADRMPAVIFVTAYDQYALRAFDVRALDYLLKPFDRPRFTEALDRARRRIGDAARTDVHERLVALMNDLRAGPSRANRIVVKTGGRLFFLRTEEIDWIEAAGNYLRLHAGRGTHLIRETMTTIEQRLDPAKFFRVHRSSIVNIDRVSALEPCPSGDYVAILADGTRVNVSRGHRDTVLERLGHPR
jgi:two-component system LytT family response regulator